MRQSVSLTFTQTPSIWTMLGAIINSHSLAFHPQKPLLPITARRDGFKTSISRLNRFAKICGIEISDTLPLVYPMTFIYPMVQVLMARREMPLLLSKMLNTRTRMVQHRAIARNESLSAFCRLAGHRMVKKGVEIDVDCTIGVSGKTVWECRITFYYRGRFGESHSDSPFIAANVLNDSNTEIKDGEMPSSIDTGATPPVLESIDAPEIARWPLPSKNKIAFARLSGDYNPLHYSHLYARFMGFERAFAQPLLVLAETLARLEDRHRAGRFTLDIAFKGPVYFGRNVILKSKEVSGSERFDLYSEGNPRPCICGKLAHSS